MCDCSKISSDNKNGTRVYLRGVPFESINSYLKKLGAAMQAAGAKLMHMIMSPVAVFGKKLFMSFGLAFWAPGTARHYTEPVPI